MIAPTVPIVMCSLSDIIIPSMCLPDIPQMAAGFNLMMRQFGSFNKPEQESWLRGQPLADCIAPHSGGGDHGEFFVVMIEDVRFDAEQRRSYFRAGAYRYLSKSRISPSRISLWGGGGASAAGAGFFIFSIWRMTMNSTKAIIRKLTTTVKNWP